MLDHLSGGRFEFGTGRGAGSHEILGFLPGMDDLSHTREIWEDVIGEFPKMWLQDEYEGYQGTYWSLPPRKVLPKPWGDGHPAMWYAAGNTSSYGMAARKGLGVLGFSWGGVVSLLTATPRWRDALGANAPPIRGHAALYPVCWAYENVPGLSLADLTGAPILIQAGDADAYDDPDGLDQLLRRLPAASRAVIRGVTHPGAGHGFDRDAPARTIVDPFAHKGVGGPVLMAFQPEAAAAARAANVAFFLETLRVT